MRNVFILGGCRSHIGIQNKTYKKIPAEQLAAGILSYIRNNIIPNGINPDCIITGNSVAGGGNISRLSALYAGFDESVPAYTVDSQCSSGLQAILNGYAQISSGLCDCIIVGGAESTSTQPLRAYNKNHPLYNAECPFYTSAQFVPDIYGNNVMIAGADETARHYGIKREDMYDYIIDSHTKAANTAKSGVLNDIIHPIFGLEADEAIRPNINRRFLERLKPILPNGITTAAASCLMNDGAAYIVLCSEEFLKQHSLHSDFKIVTAHNVAGNGMRSPETILKAIPATIKKSGLKIQDIDRIDYNEAFAVIDVLYHQHYDIPSNCFGGAIAYGHPYGASGGILMLHLMKAMKLNKEHYGLCTIPAAGGTACAIIIERTSK